MGGPRIDAADASPARVFQTLIAGSFAGAAAKSTIAPLERAKIIFQVTCGREFTLRSTARTLRDIYSQDGIPGLWRGNVATMARIMPYAGIQFTAHEHFKRVLRAGGSERDMSGARRLLAGALAGASAVTCTYPLDVMRARVAVQSEMSDTRYQGLVRAFAKVWQDHGIRGLYRGLFPTLVGIIPYAGISFYTFETLKLRYLHKSDPEATQVVSRLACGSVAGLLGQVASYPLDVIRRRMQTLGLTGSDKQYHGMLVTMRHIWHNEGLQKGFFKGITLNFIKGPIAVAISFTVFDLLKKKLGFEEDTNGGSSKGDNK